MEDEEIIRLYWDRDETAIRETDRKYSAYLTKIVKNILDDGEDTRESVNDTYYAAWNSIPPQRPNNFQAYLAKLARRIAIDHFRQRTRIKRGGGEYPLSLTELEEICSGGNTTERAVDSRMLGQAINAFLRTLEPQARTAFIGRYFYADPLNEVARYCGMSQSKAKSMLHRTRQKLKAYLEKEGLV